MGYTIAEKILGAHAGASLRPGQLVDIPVDLVLANDITAPIAIREFERIGVDKVFDRHKIVLVPDHFTPNKDIKSAEQCQTLRKFARQQDLSHYFEVGRMGIEHVLLPEQGLVAPGDVVVGADSHTCTYGALGAFATGMGSTDIAVAMATGRIWMKVPQTLRINYTGERRPWVGGKDLILYTIGKIGVDGARYMAMEFGGPAIDSLPIDDRFTMSNMAIEAGGKAGLFAVDAQTCCYLTGRLMRPYAALAPDPDAGYAEVIDIDVSQIEPQVAFPHLPSNSRAVSAANGVRIDQVVIGSCTNGRWSDMVEAADILRCRQVHRDVRCIVIPGTQDVLKQMVRAGLAEALIDAGCVVSTPTCGPCLGGHMGILGPSERCVSTTNRNFVGRMGHRTSEVYLAGPAVAAASAILGRIATPDEL